MMTVFSAADVGTLVREHRHARGFTQRDLAASCGCGTRFISELERGKPTVEFDRVMLVLNTLSIDLCAQVREF